MDFYGLKRKELQALCKKHGIPANKSNREMANLLTSTLKETNYQTSQAHGDVAKEDDSEEAPKKLKKVRFSPEIETREYEPSAYKQAGRRKVKISHHSTKSEGQKLSGKVNGSLRRSTRSMVRNGVGDIDMVSLPKVWKKRRRGDEEIGSVGVSEKSHPATKTGRDNCVVKDEAKQNRVRVRRQLGSTEMLIEESKKGGGRDLVGSGNISKRRGSKKRGCDEVSEKNLIAEPETLQVESKGMTKRDGGSALLSPEFHKAGSHAKVDEKTSEGENKAETPKFQDENDNVLEDTSKSLGRKALRLKSTVPHPQKVASEILASKDFKPGLGLRQSKRNVQVEKEKALEEYLKGSIRNSVQQKSTVHQPQEVANEIIARKDVKTGMGLRRSKRNAKGESEMELEEPLKCSVRNVVRQKSTVPQEVANEILLEKNDKPGMGVRRSKTNVSKCTDAKPPFIVESSSVQVVRRTTRFGAQFVGNTSLGQSEAEVIKVKGGTNQLDECLAEKPPRKSTRLSSKGGLSVPRKIAKMSENILSLEELPTGNTGSIMAQATVVKSYESLQCIKGNVETKKKRQTAKCKSIEKRTGAMDFSAVYSDTEEVKDATRTSEETLGPMALMVVGSSVGQETPDIASELGLIAEEAKIVKVDDMEKFVTENAVDGCANDNSCWSSENGTAFDNDDDDSTECKLLEFQTTACDVISPASSFSLAHQSNVSDEPSNLLALKTEELSTDNAMNHESDHVNYHLIEVDKKSIGEDGERNDQDTPPGPDAHNEVTQNERALPVVFSGISIDSTEEGFKADANIVSPFDKNIADAANVSEKSYNVYEIPTKWHVDELPDGVLLTAPEEKDADNCQVECDANRCEKYFSPSPDINEKYQEVDQPEYQHTPLLMDNNGIERLDTLLLEPPNLAPYTCNDIDALDEVQKNSLLQSLDELQDAMVHCGHKEEAVRLNDSVDASLAQTIFQEREYTEGNDVGLMLNNSKCIKRNDMLTEEDCNSTVSNSKIDGFAQGVDGHLVEEEAAEVHDYNNCDDTCRNDEPVDTKTNNVNVQGLKLQKAKNGGASQPSSPVEPGKKASDIGYEFLKINVAGSDDLLEVAFGGCEDADELKDNAVKAVVIETMQELQLRAGGLDNLSEKNTLDVDRSDSIGSEILITEEAKDEHTKENAGKINVVFKLKHINTEAGNRHHTIAIPDVASNGAIDHEIEEGLYENNRDIVCRNIAFEEDEAQVCFENIEDCNKWAGNTPTYSRMLPSAGKLTKPNSREGELFTDISFDDSEKGFSDNVSEHNVFSSGGKNGMCVESVHVKDGNEGLQRTSTMVSIDNKCMTAEVTEAPYEFQMCNNLVSNSHDSKELADFDNLHFVSPLKPRINEIVPSEFNFGSPFFNNLEVTLTQRNGEKVEKIDGEMLEDNLICEDSEYVQAKESATLINEVDGRAQKQLGKALFAAEPLEDDDKISEGLDNIFTAGSECIDHIYKDETVDIEDSHVSLHDVMLTDITLAGRLNDGSDMHKTSSDNLFEENISGSGILHGITESRVGEVDKEVCIGTIREWHEKIFVEHISSVDALCRKPEFSFGSSTVKEKNIPAAHEEFEPKQCFKDASGDVDREETTSAERGSKATEDEVPGSNGWTQEAIKCLTDATKDSSIENTADPEEDDRRQLSEDTASEAVSKDHIKYLALNQHLCENKSESHAIETDGAHSVHKLHNEVLTVVHHEEVVDSGNLGGISPSKQEILLAHSAVSTDTASSDHEVRDFKLNLFPRKEENEVEKSGSHTLQSNLLCENAGKVEENTIIIEYDTTQVAEDQHGECKHQMEEVAELEYANPKASVELNYEGIEGSKEQENMAVQVNEIQGSINCQSLEDESVKDEYFHVSSRKLLVVQAAEESGFHDVASSEHIVGCHLSNVKWASIANNHVEHLGEAMELNKEVLKVEASTVEQSPAFTESAIGQGIALESQKARGEETNGFYAKQWSFSVTETKNTTGLSQGTARQGFAMYDMKENMSSMMGEKIGNMTAPPEALSKRKPLEDLRKS